MGGFESLMRAYEARRFPPTRRLDLHGEGPAAARERALHWIQSHAHEAPGTELLLIVERGGRPRGRRGPVRQAVERLLDGLVGGLIEWWAPFTDGSLALRVAVEPRIAPPVAARGPADEPHGGRTPETAGAALLAPDADIPVELLPLAEQIAELRRGREGLSLGLREVVLRRVWIEAQATAMDERMPFAAALERLLAEERRIGYEED